MTREHLYAYTFLASTIVQLDPVGKLPKCLMYANAGLYTLDWKIRGKETTPFPRDMSIQETTSIMLQIAKVQADLMLHAAELSIMRSEHTRTERARLATSQPGENLRLPAVPLADHPRHNHLRSGSRHLGALQHTDHARLRNALSSDPTSR